MNIGTQYGRRRAQFIRSRTSYIHMQPGSRDSLGNESDDENETSSCSAISTQSTRSLKSYKRWRRSQRERRRNLKRTVSLQIEPTGATTLEALDLSGDHSKSALRETTDKKNEEVDLTHSERQKVNDQPRLLSTIAQSPLDPYYSSSPLTSSTDDTDSESSPKRSVTSDIEDSLENDNVKNPAPTREPFTARKDPLQRRTYPFLLSNQRRQKSLDSAQTDFERIHSRYRGIYNPAHQEKVNETEIKRRSPGVLRRDTKSTDDIKGLNVISSLADDGRKSPRSLLSMAKISEKTPSTVDNAYDDVETQERDVFFSDVNGFTISLPCNSPSISAHTLEHDNIFNMEPIAEANERDMTKADNESRDRTRKQPTNPDETNGNPNDTTESVTCPSNRSMDPMNRYFLPPLIAQAMNRAQKNSLSLIGSESDDNIDRKHDLSKTEAIHDKNSNVKRHAASAGNLKLGTALKDDETSTSSEGDDDNVYMENVDVFLDDLTEKDFIENPRTVAIPEDEDADSTRMKKSLDPIENILTRQNSERADDKTFTLNGRHVITPKQSGKDEARKIKEQATLGKEPTNVSANEQARGDVESSLSSVPDEHGCCSAAPSKPTKSRSSNTTDVGSDLCCVIL